MTPEDEARVGRIKSTLSSDYWNWALLPGAVHEDTVLHHLKSSLPHLHSWERRFEIGGVYYNGKPLLSDRRIVPPCKIEYYEPRFSIEDPSAYFPKFSVDQILYHEDGIMVIYKPPGLPAFQARDQIVCNLRAQIETHVGNPVHMPSRLDTSVGGLVLLSTDTGTHHALQRAFERREIDKEYLLQTDSKLDWDEKVVTLRIGKDELHPILRRCVPTGGQSACTYFKRAGSGGLVTAKPITGRTHQIRLHASSSGFPIIGDNFYRGAYAESLHLLSIRLQFVHPRRNQSLTFELPAKFCPAWAKKGSCSSNLPQARQSEAQEDH